MKVLCLDLEGVLIPEIWLGVAATTGISALEKTTRDIPVYDDLMQYRMQILRDHDIKLSEIQAVIAGLDPLPGAQAFIDWARQHFQVAIVSDTFYEFGMPMMRKLGYPFLLCHRLAVSDDRIVDYLLRQEDPKRHTVEAFRALHYEVYAAGDSFNDISMLQAADCGFLFRAPAHIAAEYQQFSTAEEYAELKQLLQRAAGLPAGGS